jgi:integrase
VDNLTRIFGRKAVKNNNVLIFVSTLFLSDSYVFTNGQGEPIDQSEFARGFQAALRVLQIRQRPFYNTRHTFISIALTIGCNQKWIAEQTGTSVQMIQEHYGEYIRSDGDALLRAYVKENKRDISGQENRNLCQNLFAWLV